MRVHDSIQVVIVFITTTTLQFKKNRLWLAHSDHFTFHHQSNLLVSLHTKKKVGRQQQVRNLRSMAKKFKRITYEKDSDDHYVVVLNPWANGPQKPRLKAQADFIGAWLRIAFRKPLEKNIVKTIYTLDTVRHISVTRQCIANWIIRETRSSLELALKLMSRLA